MSLLAAFFVEVALVTYRSVKAGGVTVPKTAPIPAPLPSLYTSAVLVYGGLALVPGRGSAVAGLVGWGFVVATLLNLFNPGAANAAAASGAGLTAALSSTPAAAGTSLD